MAEIVTKPVTEASEWEAFMAQNLGANFLQSWYWGDFQTEINHPVIRTGFYDNDHLVGVMLSVVEPAKRGRYLTVPGGPIIDWKNQAAVETMVRSLKAQAKEQKCSFVRVRPQLVNDEFSVSLFKRLGFRPAQMHLHAELTSQLDINKDENQLLPNFRKNTRYEIKRAKKRGIKVTHSDNPDDVKAFYELQLETAKRHDFVPYSYKFLHGQFKVFANADKVLLYSAQTAEGKLIAQAFIIFYNAEAAYHYGASTELGRKEPGAYLIQWEAIKEAKRRGCQRYNFWGVVGHDETHHRFYGVSVFKRGFRGHDVEYLHAHDLVVSWPRYLINFAIEYIRKRKRHV